MDRTFPFGEIFKATLKTLFVNFKDWMKLIAGPAALIVATVIFTTVTLLMGEVLVVVSFMLGFLLSIAASIIFTVRIYRYVIEDEMPESTWSLEWNRRHWMMILYGIAVFLLMLCIGVVLGLPVGIFMALGSEINQAVAIIYGIIAFIALVILALRFSAVTGLVAIDAPAPIKQSWAMITKRTSLKILGLVLALVIPVIVIVFILILPLALLDLGVSSLFVNVTDAQALRDIMEARITFSSIGNMVSTGLYTFAIAHVIKSLRGED